MSKNRKKLVIGVVGFAIVFFVLFGVIGLGNVTDEDVTSWIESEVPIGSTKEAVIAFCEKRGMSHSGNYKPELYYDKNRTIAASINKRWNYLLLAEGGVYVLFYFDENNKLLRYTVDEGYTFL